MDILFAYPATLAGIIGCLALGAWTLGRGQRSGATEFALRPSQPAPQHPPFEWASTAPLHAGAAALCRNPARAGRDAELDETLSLGELHAEVSAYRQREQVLSRIGNACLWAEIREPVGNHECRNAGLIGALTGPAPDAAMAACGCDRDAVSGSHSERAQVAAQPSPLTFV